MRILAQKVSEDLSHPQDRRRFSSLIDVEFFGKVLPNISKKDKIILNIHSDLGAFEKIRNECDLVVFDYCDMIHTRNPFVFYITTTLWYFKGKLKAPMSRKKFEKIIKEVDTLVVGSQAQKNLCERIRSKEIYVIEDYFEEINTDTIVTNCKKSRGIVWEGLAGGNFMILLKCFQIAKLSGLNLIVVTDLKYPLFSGILMIRTERLLRLISLLTGNKNFDLRKWTKNNLKLAAQEGEYILIPLRESNSLEYYKPANKAVLSLMMGLKPVMFRTPDYELLSNMISANRSLCFTSTAEALNLLEHYPRLNEKKIDEYVKIRNKKTLALKWKAILS